MLAHTPPRAKAALTVEDLLAAQSLRDQAERELHERGGDNAPRRDDPLFGALYQMHDLRVHKIELEMQNEELRLARQALELSRASFVDLYDQAPVGYLSVNQAGLIVRANLTAATLLGLPRNDLLQQPLSQWVVPDSQDMVYLLRKQVRLGDGPQTFELGLQRVGSPPWWARLVAQAVQDETGAPVLRVALNDISAQRDAQEKLQLAASVFLNSREGIMITDLQASIVEVNQAFCRITGFAASEVLGQNPRMLSSGRHAPDFYVNLWRDLRAKGHWYGEVWNRRKSGEVYAELQTISTVCNTRGQPTHYVSLFSDISAYKAHQSELEHIAHYDLLTHLPNRALLADRLHQSMAQTLRRGDLLGVAYIDLDSFKCVNDGYGHAVGDQLLVTLATRMKETLRDGDTLARMGGDEFVAVLTGLKDVQACQPMLARLLAAAAQPVLLGEVLHQVSASLGVSFYPQTEGVAADQLLRQADQAMYQAKQLGKNRFHVFDAEQDRSVRGHHESLARIRLALDQHELVLYYQPKVNMRTGQVTGAEALIRWQHPSRGLLLPAEFLPVIETDPLAIAVGEWVIDTALAQITLWQAAGLVLPVSVNVGAFQLQQPSFVAQLGTLLARQPQVAPSSLTLEVLETSALQDIGYASQVIDDCLQLGVAFALDDFGTGYSSLTYLKRLRVGLLKIDQSFVRDMLVDPGDLSILQGVIGLASAFHCDVIAEGVETLAHGTLLLQMGCELAQGYGIARPMPAEEMPGWVAAWQPPTCWQPGFGQPGE